jgi:protein-L-isoaspartate O-methyltransferase
MLHMAYDDSPLPIGHDQTISQPYIVALMAEAAAIQVRSLAIHHSHAPEHLHSYTINN